jgi:hypothetical protein
LVGSFETELDPLEQKTIEEINSNTDIISVGFKKDVRPFMSRPNVVMQAGAMELPSIVTNING